MSISRNEPCPCGSGKKYKKCCLQKENIIQLDHVKEEKFLQQKHNLVIKLNDFLEKKLSLNEIYHLQSEFKQRTKRLLPKNVETSFFQFWHYFFHRFENGLRGIEWFYQENESRLSQEEREMAKTWTILTPRLLQAVKKEEKEILFEDIFTKEQFPVPNNESNVPSFIPWFSTFAVPEPFQGKHYFNGVRQFNGPAAVDFTSKKINELMEEKGQDHKQILVDYFPEILAQFISNEDLFKKEDEEDEFEEVSHEIYQFTLNYNVLDQQEVINFFSKQEEFVMDELDEKDTHLQISWAKNWSRYVDSEMDGSIIFAEVLASISIKDEALTFVSFDEKHVREFEARMKDLTSILSFKDEAIDLLTLPINAQVKNMLIKIDGDNIPEYFALYVQHDLSSELDTSIPLYNNSSLRELVRIGQSGDAQTWLKQTEYNMYLRVLNQYEKVDVTADFNSVRKELGLPLSPFVTGGENRQSSIIPIERPDKPVVLVEEDISDYEELGLSAETMKQFYAADLVNFYEEKTNGKAENTVRKYRNSLMDLSIILKQKSLSSWAELDESFWKQLFAEDFPGLYDSAISKTHQNEFLSTMNALAKWIDGKYNTNCASYIKQARELVLR
ncbi:YecA family protein [Metabacillus fastidiosus]|uniref:YecA family protein n=1 Tax=Metabacillus fastidiosus TaxID=1458 RepID=UPI002DBAEB0A|nr:SEC-C metal-binding domain-containing protein [Metabacillus fastidiosus]MEC2076054.1 SEC-C metal-binding domain-containing protein [Metabacillus fastidiosus]